MLWKGIGVLATIAALGAVAGHVASADDAPPATGSVRVGALDPGARSGMAPGRCDDVLEPSAEHARDPRPRRRSPRSRRVPGRRRASAATARGRTVRSRSCRRPGVCWPSSATARTPSDPCRSPAARCSRRPRTSPLRLRAPEVLAALDATRVKERGAWTDTSARRLAAAHRAALEALRPVASASLTRALSGAAVAVRRPRTERGRPADDAARDDVAAADRTLDGVVAALAREGAPKVQRPPAATAAATGGGGASCRCC